MSCIEFGKVIVCVPFVDGWGRSYIRCPHCKTRRLYLWEFQDYYGSRCICLTCGQRWMDGECAYYSKRDSPKDALEAKERVKKYVTAQIPQGLGRYMERLKIEFAEQAGL